MPCRTAGLIVQATTLHAEVAAVCAQSRALIERGRERRRFSAYPRLRPISGGSDAALVVMTITDATVCLPCIARNTGIPVEQVNGLLRTITRTLRLRIGPHRCDACLQHKTTFSVTKDVHP